MRGRASRILCPPQRKSVNSTAWDPPTRPLKSLLLYVALSPHLFQNCFTLTNETTQYICIPICGLALSFQFFFFCCFFLPHFPIPITHSLTHPISVSYKRYSLTRCSSFGRAPWIQHELLSKVLSVLLLRLFLLLIYVPHDTPCFIFVLFHSKIQRCLLRVFFFSS